MRIKEIDFENKFYPTKLREIDKPPNKLYVLGDEKILNNESLSIIGSRNCSEYGQKIARKMSQKLANHGICIVSGMARGIDSEAHIGAIEGGGKTIAVLGSGFNHIFPDKSVFEKILKSGGAVITEYNKEVDVFPQGFRDRNRIVAGLSIGTLVIEAKQKSGTSITAGFAKSYDRKIFCIPHALEDETGFGTNRLLKNGAILITEVEDLYPYFNNIEKNRNEIIIDIPEEYRNIYEQFKGEALNVDEIRKKVKLNISELNTMLTMMELEGYIESLPGNYFKRKEI